jgi:hypothetical protein
MYEPDSSGNIMTSASGGYSLRLPGNGDSLVPISAASNPLARAVNLTLGVALLGSLIGGVQLYGMIGMHGLLRADPRDIPDPWYGYQVALRVLEVMICYLLAVVATTPLRQDSGGKWCDFLFFESGSAWMDPGLRIRIPVGSGFYQVSGSGSGSRRAKLTHKSRKKN